jgi:hypothetical protein
MPTFGPLASSREVSFCPDPTELHKSSRDPLASALLYNPLTYLRWRDLMSSFHKDGFDRIGLFAP